MKFEIWFCLFIFCSPQSFGAVSADVYPQRFIDRPYTLPVGVREFEINGKGSFPLGTQNYNYYEINGFYRQALSENYTLLWAPLPLGLQYQIAHTSEETVGAAWELDFSYDEGLWSLRPKFSSFYLNKPANDFAWDTRIFYFWNIPLANNDTTWTAELSSGPLFQISDAFSVSPRGGADLKNFVLRKITEQASANVPSPDFTYFFGVRGQLAQGHLWDVTVNTKFDGLNFSGADIHLFEVNLALTEYW